MDHDDPVPDQSSDQKDVDWLSGFPEETSPTASPGSPESTPESFGFFAEKNQAVDPAAVAAAEDLPSLPVAPVAPSLAADAIRMRTSTVSPRLAAILFVGGVLVAGFLLLRPSSLDRSDVPMPSAPRTLDATSPPPPIDPPRPSGEEKTSEGPPRAATPASPPDLSAIGPKRLPPSPPVPQPPAEKPANADKVALPGVATPSAASAEITAIESVLADYRRAAGTLDAARVEAVFPQADRHELGRAFDALAFQALEFSDCQIDVAGDDARAACRGRARVVPKASGKTHLEPRQWTFTLKQGERGWVIQSVQSAPAKQ